MHSDLAAIQPVVLAGGRSSRFGRDKLREPLNSERGHHAELLVDRPIAALRRIFGPRVALVGECHESVTGRADAVIRDVHPGCGPIGGIISALQAVEGDVFVLAGDLPHITSDVVAAIVGKAKDHPQAHAVMAFSDRLEPCIALYRQAALSTLRARLAEGRRRLHDALAANQIVTVPVDAQAVTNVNTPAALAQQIGGAA